MASIAIKFIYDII